MKNQIFVLALLAIMISSCSGDDDTNTNTNTNNDTIIGTWILESTTEQGYNQNIEGVLIGCDTSATTLKFDKETTVNINSMVVVQNGTKLCVSGGSEEITDDTIKLIKGTFPPPKDIFSYKLQGDILTLTDGGNDDFVFKRAN
ncbi:hypothetical protein [Aquimarina macrocephali]|uniref:hypothetical protein n=1 Tax=Aquimarina macrocephali TaxID=666563 RepID=UPI00046679D8|nr:hypothetical protein [Aquimarina macrocephali]